jgi:hypothetical protein
MNLLRFIAHPEAETCNGSNLHWHSGRGWPRRGLMSALGQKRTHAAHQPMSALPPIATAKAYSRNRPCPRNPQKRTCAVQLGMSAMGQKRTSGDAELETPDPHCLDQEMLYVD